MKGQVHIYTGDGKGKTTAAFGLTLRAVGAGKKVFFAQFVKSQIYSEVRATLEFLPSVTIKQYGLDCFIVNTPTQADIDAARAGFDEVSKIIKAGNHDLVVLDEANIAVFYNLFSEQELMELILSKPHPMELVITGRYATPKLIELADLVTEMKEIKHYYTKGIEAREGIEF